MVMGGVGSGICSGGSSGGGRWQGGIVNSVSDGDGNDGLAVENPDVLNVGGVRSLDFEEHAGAVYGSKT
jgi:hypothetical protein